jgi:hypothetical protein
MTSDHADESFAHLQAIAAADAHLLPDPSWVEHPWIDRLGELSVPVPGAALPRAGFGRRSPGEPRTRRSS